MSKIFELEDSVEVGDKGRKICEFHVTARHSINAVVSLAKKESGGKGDVRVGLKQEPFQAANKETGVMSFHHLICRKWEEIKMKLLRVIFYL